MSDINKAVQIIFNGEDNTGAATKSAIENFKRFSESTKSITQPVSEFTINTAKLEAGLLAAGAAMTVFAVKTAGDFEQSFAQITTLFDASAGDVAKFKQAILDYASTSGKSLHDIDEALLAAIGSGVEYSKSLDLIAVAEKLAIATRADLKGTTEVLVSTMNAYGMKTEESGKVADLFFQIIKDGKIEMNDLAHGFAMVSPVAAASGVSLQEVGAAIAVLTASGIAPSTAIEYLRSALTNIIKPSAQATNEAKALGIQFDANALKSKGLAGVLDDVAKATHGDSGAMAKLIGDVGGLVAAMVLTGPQAGKFAEEIKAMGTSSGSVSEAYAKMANSMEVVGQRVTNAMQGMLISIGTPMLDAFGGVANAIAHIFTAISDSAKNGGLKDLVSYVESQMKSLQASIETVAKNLPAVLAKADFSGFKGGIDAVIKAVKSLFGGLDLSSADGLKTAIETLGAAFLGLSKYTAGVIESFKPLFDTLVAVGKGAKDANMNFLEIAGGLGGLITQINIAMPLLDGFIALLAVNQGLGIAKQLGSLSSILPSVVALIAGPAGFALALTALAYESYKAEQAIMSLSDANAKLKSSQEQGLAIHDRAASSLERFAQTSGLAVKSIDEADKLISSGTVVWSTATNGWVKAGDALADVAQAASSAQADFRKSEIAMQNQAGAAEKSADSTAKLASVQKDVSKYALETVPIYDKLTGAITGYEQKLVKSSDGTINLAEKTDAASKSLTNITEKTKKAEEAQAHWNEVMANLQSKENIAAIEGNTKIAVAQVEADAKKVIAAYESINSTVMDTSKSIANLFSLLVAPNAMDWSTYRSIQAETQKESQRRDDALKLQKDLTTAQIDLMKSQTKAFEKGDAQIRISGDGLKPHLEAFMWEILQTIQVRVNADGLKLLLGT